MKSVFIVFLLAMLIAVANATAKSEATMMETLENLFDDGLIPVPPPEDPAKS